MASIELSQKSRKDEELANDSEFLRALEESDRLLHEFIAERDKRLQAEAIAKGFSSWEEEKEQHVRVFEERRIAAGQFREEQAATMGITVEELLASDPQNRDSPWMEFYLPNGDCECDEHPFPTFCPTSLVNYRSQDAPGYMEFLADQHRLDPEKFDVKQGDSSRRLPPELLRYLWGENSQPKSCQWPFWAMADDILQKIIHGSLPFDDQVSGNSGYSPANSVYTKEIVPVTEPGKNALSTREANDDAELDFRNNATTPPLVGASQKLCQFSPRPTLKSKRNPSKPTKPPRIRPRRACMALGSTSRVRKSLLPPSRSTRSRNIANFYELDKIGAAVALQNLR